MPSKLLCIDSRQHLRPPQHVSFNALCSKKVSTSNGASSTAGQRPAVTPQPMDHDSAQHLNYEDSRTDVCHAAQLLDLPDSLLQQHLLPLLGGADKKMLRLTAARPRHLINQCVQEVHIPAHALKDALPGFRLGMPFPAARVLKAFDVGDACIADGDLLKFLSASGPWLEQVQEVDLKQCHQVTAKLLSFLRTACPKLRKLAASRWAEHTAMAEIARFPVIEELDLGDADTDIITVDDLSMSQLAGLAPTLKRLSLARCRWVSSCEPLKALVQLELLDLSHTDVGPRALEALAELPALEGLNLTGCRNITDEALLQLPKFPALKVLVLRGTAATNDGLKPLAGLSNLEHLDLGSKWELNDAGLSAVASCVELRVLTVGSFNLVKPLLGHQDLRRLEHLSFGGGFANKGLHLLFPLLNLRSLHITGMDSVTDCVMRHISNSQKQLQQLALRCGYSLTPVGLRQLAALANLAVLSVGACPAINKASLQAFTAAHARLSMLLEGACPLMPDSSHALCALAPERAAGVPTAQCVRVN